MLKMPLLPSRGLQGLPVVPRSLSVHRSFPFLFQPAATLAKGKYTYGLFSVLKRYYMIGGKGLGKVSVGSGLYDLLGANKGEWKEK